ncbi:MAG: carboxypeptidase-like regulatory domain-containing protein, partial [Gemmatimonadetes bacterium]|nr:carboxypeptidase-like regulatory domain-containing protein [Gemmatimonadota bacterium]
MPGKAFLCSALILALLSIAVPPSASAQSRTTATVLGIVTEGDSTAVAGAVVEIRHEETGVTRSALSNDRGQYLILLLPPGGPYTLTVNHLGFGQERREGLVLQVGDAFRVDVELREEAIELPGIDVEVDRAPVFDPNQVGPVTRLTERTVEAMP